MVWLGCMTPQLMGAPARNSLKKLHENMQGTSECTYGAAYLCFTGVFMSHIRTRESSDADQHQRESLSKPRATTFPECPSKAIACVALEELKSNMRTEELPPAPMKFPSLVQRKQFTAESAKGSCRRLWPVGKSQNFTVLSYPPDARMSEFPVCMSEQKICERKKVL